MYSSMARPPQRFHDNFHGNLPRLGSHHPEVPVDEFLGHLCVEATPGPGIWGELLLGDFRGEIRCWLLIEMFQMGIGMTIETVSESHRLEGWKLARNTCNSAENKECTVHYLTPMYSLVGGTLSQTTYQACMLDIASTYSQKGIKRPSTTRPPCAKYWEPLISAKRISMLITWHNWLCICWKLFPKGVGFHQTIC